VQLAAQTANIWYKARQDYGLSHTIFLHSTVKNEPRRVPFVPRQTAMGVHGSIEFLDNAKNSICGKMPIRWDGTPEPLKYEIVNGEVVTLADLRLLRVSKFIDIYPDEQESLGIAIRLEGEDNAFVWTTDSYFHSWRHPDFTISQGDFYSRVTVKAGSESFIRDVPFINPGEFEDFDLLSEHN
jgi:hypothetical protein